MMRTGVRINSCLVDKRPRPLLPPPQGAVRGATRRAVVSASNSRRQVAAKGAPRASSSMNAGGLHRQVAARRVRAPDGNVRGQRAHRRPAAVLVTRLPPAGLLLRPLVTKGTGRAFPAGTLRLARADLVTSVATSTMPPRPHPSQTLLTSRELARKGQRKRRKRKRNPRRGADRMPPPVFPSTFSLKSSRRSPLGGRNPLLSGAGAEAPPLLTPGPFMTQMHVKRLAM